MVLNFLKDAAGDMFGQLAESSGLTDALGESLGGVLGAGADAAQTVSEGLQDASQGFGDVSDGALGGAAENLGLDSGGAAEAFGFGGESEEGEESESGLGDIAGGLLGSLFGSLGR